MKTSVSKYIGGSSRGRTVPGKSFCSRTEGKGGRSTYEVHLQNGTFLMYSQTMCLDCYARIDLIIVLIPRTSSFSMVPYRMTLVELAELKVQLDDLTSEGFIRQRISGRGTDTVGEEEGWEV